MMHSANRPYGIHKFTFVFTILLTFVVVGPLSAKYGGGSGTPDNPYLIYDANQMNAIGTDANDWSKYFKLMADINLGGFTGTSYNIIGTVATPFTGVFDGNGLAISNFTYDCNGMQFIGLFGYLAGETPGIKNVTLVNPDVNAHIGYNVGTLAGYSLFGTISNCRVDGGRVSGEQWVGGLVGYLQQSSVEGCYSNCAVDGNFGVGVLAGRAIGGTVSDCCTGGTVYGRSCSAGGLLGEAFYTTIVNCCATGNVGGYSGVGGLVGISYDSLVSRCWASCDVSTQFCWYFGGLIGENMGMVRDSYATGTITGPGWGVGGLAGYNYADPCWSWEVNITNCYSTTTVNGGGDTGGLVGTMNGGTISKCYSMGKTIASNSLGGFLGNLIAGTVSDCFWDTETSGTTRSAAGIGKTTVQMQTLSTYTDAGWDFNTPVWKIPCPNNYPRLEWEVGPYHPYSGCGTEDDPFLIYTAEEIQAIGSNLGDRGKHFALMADINLADLNSVPFNIIGNNTAKFYGVFDGRGHTISNFGYAFTGTENDNIGLFSYVDGNNAVIRNLSLVGADVNGGSGDNVGLLVGRLRGTIANCYVEGGSVFGDSYVGGLAGMMTGGGIYESYCSASVIGEHYVGGEVGILSGKTASVADCYSTGSVTGLDHIGGFAGGNVGDMSRCYSTGAVTGTSYVGGFAGWGTGTVTASFWDVNTSGQATSAGGVGLPTDQMQEKNTFASTGWDFVGGGDGPNDVWAICEGFDYPRIAWQFNIGNFDDDNDVDFIDFAVLGTRWRQSDASFWCGAGFDFTDDGELTLDDLVVFSDHWLEGI